MKIAPHRCRDRCPVAVVLAVTSAVWPFLGQTSPARPAAEPFDARLTGDAAGRLPGLLQQIAPAAEAGARAYSGGIPAVAGFRCAPSCAAPFPGDGDPC